MMERATIETFIVNCEQGTEEWHAARAGAITASNFKTATEIVNGLTDQQALYVDAILQGLDEDAAKKAGGYKKAPTSEKVESALRGERVGDFSDSGKNYAFRKAIERITGEPLKVDTPQTWQMKRGNALEPMARAEHQERIQKKIVEVGAIKSKCERFLYSPDGLIDSDGLAEYKCLTAEGSMRKVLFEESVEDYFHQMQGGMWLADREWCDFVMYAPQLEFLNLDFNRRRIYRDEPFIKKMVADLILFDELVEESKHRLLKLGESGWFESLKEGS